MDRILEVIAHRMIKGGKDRLEGFLRADVTGGVGGFHPDNAILVVRGFAEPLDRVWPQFGVMPIPQLSNRRGPGEMVFATQQRCRK